ncbi:acyl-CoA thioester hydrolase [Halohasta litchfieldiae]|uniref:Acyl-CoA thioester hydrolase n=1 Tax=Halohasta litchfieldiae TaxID=1073996 RepID=A0A1H6RP18_9EURY|nr:thioesterase family protein [Halohasta litchfieldiae]ATW89225.1 acyl-CoA thioester hydrolase [Halohasta litchfieldiae]SEI57558.1 acyl-CoA thioester hydrolase [Halohasta litchfieldiae]
MRLVHWLESSNTSVALGEESTVPSVHMDGTQRTSMDVDHPVTIPVPVRFRDLDPLGHVNNAVHASYIEEARVAYFKRVLDIDLDTVGTVVASLSIDYRQPIELGDELVVEIRVPKIGTTSLTTEYELRADGDVVATATVVQVLYDYEEDEPTPIPDDWRSTIERFEDHDTE